MRWDYIVLYRERKNIHTSLLWCLSVLISSRLFFSLFLSSVPFSSHLISFSLFCPHLFSSVLISSLLFSSVLISSLRLSSLLSSSFLIFSFNCNSCHTMSRHVTSPGCSFVTQLWHFETGVVQVGQKGRDMHRSCSRNASQGGEGILRTRREGDLVFHPCSVSYLRHMCCVHNQMMQIRIIIRIIWDVVGWDNI